LFAFNGNFVAIEVFNIINILILANLGSPGKMAVKTECVCVVLLLMSL